MSTKIRGGANLKTRGQGLRQLNFRGAAPSSKLTRKGVLKACGLGCCGHPTEQGEQMITPIAKAGLQNHFFAKYATKNLMPIRFFNPQLPVFGGLKNLMPIRFLNPPNTHTKPPCRLSHLKQERGSRHYDNYFLYIASKF